MTTQMGAGGLVGHRVLDNEGNNVGRIGQVYYDDATDAAKWVTVKTGLFGNHESFVPLQGARSAGDDIRVPYGKQRIKDAPHFDAGQHISRDDEMRIYDHYDIRYPGVPGQRGSGDEMEEGEPGRGRHAASDTGVDTGSGMAADADTDSSTAADTGMAGGTDTDTSADTGPGGPTAMGAAAHTGASADAETDELSATEAAVGTDADAEVASMTRFEEQVQIGAERQEAGRIHLRKHVDTEPFQETVPIMREEVSVEREPVDGRSEEHTSELQSRGHLVCRL